MKSYKQIYFLIFIISIFFKKCQLIELLYKEKESICSNITATKDPESCYSLKTLNPNNICAFYHVIRIDLNNYKIVEYQKCSEISFKQSSIEELKRNIDDFIDDQNSLININFGVSKQGGNLCSEFSYKNLNRTLEETDNFCKQSYVNFEGNKCCSIEMEFEDYINNIIYNDYRCLEAANEEEADLISKYMADYIKKQTFFEIKKLNLNCYDSKQVIYDKD